MTKLQWCVIIGVTISFILQLYLSIAFGIRTPINSDSASSILSEQATNASQYISIPKAKSAAKYITPVQYQQDRATCWAFSSMAVLEHSYRVNGIQKGFLTEEEYLPFSEQAYAIDVLQACKNHNYVNCPSKKFDNSTNGGFVQWLWAFSELQNLVVPLNTCDYSSKNDEWECANKAPAQKSNPLRYKINDMKIYKNFDKIRKVAEKTQHLSMAISIYSASFKIPAKDTIISEIFKDNIKPCDDNAEEKCIYIPTTQYNPDGEYYTVDMEVNQIGSHFVTIVGYNDNYVNKDGSKGIFIVKDSRSDYGYKNGEYVDDLAFHGSHTVGYFMNEHSAWDERTICPNPQNPLNWDSCVILASGPTGDADVMYPNIETTCLNEKYMSDYIDNYKKPVEFKCVKNVDNTFCDEKDNGKYRFFLTKQ